MKKLLKLLKDKKGSNAVEYSLIVALIACAIIGATYALGVKIQGTFNYVASVLPGF